MCLLLARCLDWYNNKGQHHGAMETVATNNNPAGNRNSVGAKGTQVAAVRSRLTVAGVDVPLARFGNIAAWDPQVSDFIIWHGWFSRWYGVVSLVLGDNVLIVKENLPCLLFSMPQSEYEKNSIQVPISKIKGSQGGEFHVLQKDIWYIEAREVNVRKEK